MQHLVGAGKTTADIVGTSFGMIKHARYCGRQKFLAPVPVARTYGVAAASALKIGTSDQSVTGF